MGVISPKPSEVRTLPTDVERHNEEVRRVWEAYRSDKPIRVPFSGGIGLRQHQAWFGYSLREFFLNPEEMWRRSLELQRFNRSVATGDHELGLPDQWGPVAVYWMNAAEAEWLGCAIRIDDSESIWVQDGPLRKHKERLYDLEIPPVFSTELGRRTVEYLDYFREKAKTEEFEGRPVAPPTYAGFRTQGPFELACHLRGATEACIDLCEDPQYFHDLMDFCTRAIITRIRAVYGDLLDGELPLGDFAYADDSIALLGPTSFQEHVWPYHKRIIDAVAAPGKQHFIHLCGTVQHHLPFLAETGLISYVGTSYPVDIARARKDAGSDLWLDTAVHAEEVLHGTPRSIEAAVAEKLTREAKGNGRLVFMGGNYVAPGTSLANFVALYEAVRRHGTY